MDKTAADNLAAALAILATVADNAELHAENCPFCTGHFKCQSAEFWAREAEDAAKVVERRQQQLRRATLAAAR